MHLCRNCAGIDESRDLSKMHFLCQSAKYEHPYAYKINTIVEKKK